MYTTHDLIGTINSLAGIDTGHPETPRISFEDPNAILGGSYSITAHVATADTEKRFRVRVDELYGDTATY